MVHERNFVAQAPPKKRRLNQPTRQEPQSSSPTSFINDLLRSEKKQQNMEGDLLAELERALGVLHSYRQTPSETQTEVDIHTIGKSSVDFIPGLVNRIILESSDVRGCRRTPAMTKLLVQIVLTFVEPYLIEVAAQSLPAQTKQQQETKSNIEGQASDSNVGGKPNRDRYRDRAVKWAVERLKDLLRPSVKTDIPELDALLSATGSHDGIEHEARVQRVLLSSIGMMEDELSRRDDGDSGENKEMKQYLDERRVHLGNIMSEFPASGLQKDISSLLTKKIMTKQEIWSLFPDKWVAELQSKQGIGTNSQHEDAIADFPFLGQMKDFLERHAKDDSI